MCQWQLQQYRDCGHPADPAYRYIGVKCEKAKQNILCEKEHINDPVHWLDGSCPECSKRVHWSGKKFGGKQSKLK